jgi:hypothetical protein
MSKVQQRILFFTVLFMFFSILSEIKVNAQKGRRTSQNQATQVDFLYEDRIYIANLQTVQMFKEGWELSYPIMNLNSNERLILSFDDLDAGVKNYSYTIIHCDADWKPSGLFQAEYLDGFYQAEINEYSASFNTFVKYTNYRLEIPNENMRPKYSGNYLLKVFQNYNENDVVLTRRFYINENAVSISGMAKRPVLTRYMDCCQEIIFSVHHPNFPIHSPLTDLKVIVSQNNRPDIKLSGLQPQYIKTNELVYENQTTQVFQGGNEFRNFDLKSMRYQSEFIQGISFEHPYHYVDLFPGKLRASSRYFFDNDLNGNFVVQIQEGVRNATDADYAVINFSLETPIPFDEDNVYVTGRFTDWNTLPINQMDFNEKDGIYELSMLLKQGYYNYYFTVVDKNTSEKKTGAIEGNFYETENDYYIYVYFREPGSRYDRLIGYERINSSRR